MLRRQVLSTGLTKEGDTTYLELSASSEHPVMTWGEYDVLGHDPSEVDVTRTQGEGKGEGMPFLTNQTCLLYTSPSPRD